MLEELKRDLVPIERAGRHPALVLNADYRPLNLFPLKVMSWQKALKAVFLDRVDVIEQHDRVIRSPSIEMRLPSIIVLRQHVKRRRLPAFTRANIYLRDKSCCGYCGHKFATVDLTLDHVIPQSRGGRRSWQNIITACQPCNGRKDNRTPEEAHMPILWRPWVPSQEELHRAGRRFPPGSIPASWHAYLDVDDMAA